MRQSCNDMDNGTSEVDAIHKFGRMSNSAEIRKFTSALAQSIERGGAELSDFLGRQSIEMWTLKKQLMLQKGEAACIKVIGANGNAFYWHHISCYYWSYRYVNLGHEPQL